MYPLLTKKLNLKHFGRQCIYLRVLLAVCMTLYHMQWKESEMMPLQIS